MATATAFPAAVATIKDNNVAGDFSEAATATALAPTARVKLLSKITQIAGDFSGSGNGNCFGRYSFSAKADMKKNNIRGDFLESGNGNGLWQLPIR